MRDETEDFPLQHLLCEHPSFCHTIVECKLASHSQDLLRYNCIWIQIVHLYFGSR